MTVAVPKRLKMDATVKTDSGTSNIAARLTALGFYLQVVALAVFGVAAYFGSYLLGAGAILLGAVASFLTLHWQSRYRAAIRETGKMRNQ